MKRLLACLLATAVILALVSTGASARDDAAAPAAYLAHDAKVTILSTMLTDDDGIGEWGFAALVEVDGHRVLFDTGARPETVLRNAQELKIDLSQVTDVVLSHFHGDHTGGLLTLRKELSARNPKALSRLHVAKGIFDVRQKSGRPENLNQMIAVGKMYAASGGDIIVHDGPGMIAPGVWLTGPVTRRFPEHNWSGNLIVPTAAGPIEDNIAEDMSLVINAKQGLVLVTGCGHAGIGNIVAQAREMMAHAPVSAIIGGLHLYEADDSKIVWTAGELRNAGVRYLLAAHCTGIEATFRLRALLNLDRKTAVVAAVGASYSIAQGIDPLTLAR
jgi:7,8-dihydropterin-6-yl-methyl-4-(beta-D-ribofuranosyl)aminobenzene 5'-phosphate synthase